MGPRGAVACPIRMEIANWACARAIHRHAFRLRRECHLAADAILPLDDISMLEKAATTSALPSATRARQREHDHHLLPRAQPGGVRCPLNRS